MAKPKRTAQAGTNPGATSVAAYSDVVHAMLAERTARYRKRAVVGFQPGRDMLVFRRCDTTYAVDLQQLYEARPLQRLTRVPGAAAVVKGVVYAHGRVISVHDLASLGALDAPVSAEPWFIVGAGAAASVALLVDAVDGVVRVADDEIAPPPINLPLGDDCLTGVTRDGHIVINLPGLVAQPRFFCA